MAQTRPQQLSSTDFQERRQWAVLPASAQENPAAYRQPKYHPKNDNFPALLDAFNQLIHQIDPVTGQLKPEFTFARIVMRALDKLTYLYNMADKRNPVPTTDLQDPVEIDKLPQLCAYWHFEKTMTFLQSRCLHTLRDHRRRRTIDNWEAWVDPSEANYLIDHMDDVKDVETYHYARYAAGTGGLRDEFSWIPAFMDSTADARNSLIAAVAWSLHDDGRDLKRALINVLEDVPQMTRLIITLLEREDSFDEVLSDEHIFNCLFDKRIVLLDGEAMAELWDDFMDRGMEPDPNLLNDVYAADNDIEDRLYPYLTKYQRSLNRLFDYRYIMDWTRNKMWDHLFVIVNPMFNITEDTIKKFLDWSGQNGFVAENVFRVHPATHNQMEERQCSVCLGEFHDEHHPIGVTAMKTKCGHYFHPRCIFLSWDRYNFWQNMCPMCRAPAGRLRDALPEASVYDVDYEYEGNDNLRMNDYWSRQVENLMQAGNNNVEILAPHILNAYFLNDVIKGMVRTYARNAREAARPTWSSVLGGGS